MFFVKLSGFVTSWQKRLRSFCCLVFAGELQTQNNEPLVANEGEADDVIVFLKLPEGEGNRLLRKWLFTPLPPPPLPPLPPRLSQINYRKYYL